jgi:hypothetical protein
MLKDSKDPNGRVHRSVALSLPPCKIILLLHQTVHLRLSNRTLHAAAVKTLLPNRVATDNSGMIYHVRVTGQPLMCMSHMYVDVTTRPLVSATHRGYVVFHLLTTGVPSMMKIWVAPESAIESFILRLKTAPAKAGAGKEMLVLREVQVLDMQQRCYCCR